MTNILFSVCPWADLSKRELKLISVEERTNMGPVPVHVDISHSKWECKQEENSDLKIYIYVIGNIFSPDLDVRRTKFEVLFYLPSGHVPFRKPLVLLRFQICETVLILLD